VPVRVKRRSWSLPMLAERPPAARAPNQKRGFPPPCCLFSVAKIAHIQFWIILQCWSASFDHNRRHFATSGDRPCKLPISLRALSMWWVADAKGSRAANGEIQIWLLCSDRLFGQEIKKKKPGDTTWILRGCVGPNVLLLSYCPNFVLLLLTWRIT